MLRRHRGSRRRCSSSAGARGDGDSGGTARDKKKGRRREARSSGDDEAPASSRLPATSLFLGLKRAVEDGSRRPRRARGGGALLGWDARAVELLGGRSCSGVLSRLPLSLSLSLFFLLFPFPEQFLFF